MKTKKSSSSKAIHSQFIALTDKYDRLVELNEAGQIGVWFIRPSSEVIEFSDTAREIYELKMKNDFSFRELFKVIHPDGIKHINKLREDFMNKGIKSFSLRHRMVTKSGSIKYLATWGMVKFRDEEIEEIYGAIKDITTEVGHERAEKMARRYLNVAIEVNQIALWQYNIDDDYEGTSKWYEMLGYVIGNRGVVKHNTWEELLHPSDKKGALQNFNRYLNGTDPEYKDVFRLKRVDNSYAYIRTTGHAVKLTDGGKPRKIIGIHSDISDIMKIQEELADSEFKRNFIVENAADVVVQTDVKGNIVFETERFVTRFRTRYDNRKTLIEFVYDNDKKVFINSIAAISVTNQMVSTTCRLNYGNKHCWFDWYVRGIFDEKENLVSYIYVGHDITDKVLAQKKMRETQANLRMLVDNVSDIIFKMDYKNRITYTAENTVAILGYKKQEMIGRMLLGIVFDEDIDEITKVLDDLRNNIGKDIMLTKRVKTVNGPRWYEWIGRGLNEEGDVICVGRDVTDLLERQHENEELVKKIDTTLDVAGIATWDWNIKTSEITYSPMLFKLLNRPNVPVEKHGFDMINKWIHPDDLEEVVEGGPQKVKANLAIIESKFRLQKANGKYIWISSRGYVTEWDNRGYSARALGVYINITEQQKLQDKLEFLAYHDELTGLQNRERMMQIMEEHKKNHKRERAAGIYLDLDNFKATNDIFGHAVGDMLLKSIAQTIEERVGNKGTCTRLAGDEFFVFIPSYSSREEVIDLTNKLLSFIGSSSTMSNEHAIDISTSAGIVFYPEDTKDIQRLINYSDIAMLQAKKIGKNRYVLYNGKVTKQYYKSYRLLHDIRVAINKHEFEMYYQPVVDLNKNSIVQIEALLRWKHPNYGILLPSDFMHVAETSGEISNIFKDVFKGTLLQLSKCHKKQPDLALSVNLSAKQLTEQDLSDFLINMIDEVGIAPHLIIFEITETSLLHMIEPVKVNLEALRIKGCRLSLDDFGVEYSSLAMLEKINFDIIKIDRYFVSNFEESFVSKEIIKMIRSIINGLKKQSIVEGIETSKQRDIMQGLGFNWMQGFYFAKPMPAKEMEKMIKRQH